MTLDQFKTNAEKAIRANFSMRKACVFSDPKRQDKIKRQQREAVRKWIASLRLARDPATCERVAEIVRWKVC